MLYIFILLLIFIGIYQYDYRHVDRGRLFYWILLLIIFICLAGFRYRMGTDSINYETTYERDIPTLDRLKLMDFYDLRYMPGYILLASVSRTISNEFMLLQFIISTIINCVVFWFFWKNTKHVFFALLLYSIYQYFNLNTEVLREALAVCCFLLAWPFFKDGKWILYYLMAILAFMFHISAAVMFLIPIFWIPGIRWAFQYGIRTYFISICVILLSLLIGILFYKFISVLAVTDSMAERTEAYSNNRLGVGLINFAGLLSNIVQYVFYPLLAMYFIRKINPEKAKSKLIQKTEFMSILGIYSILFSTGVFIFTRYNNYFFFFSILIISDFIFSLLPFKNKKVRFGFLTWIILFIPLIVLPFYSYYNRNVNRDGTLKVYMMYYPYSHQFDKEMNIKREKLHLYYKRH